MRSKREDGAARLGAARRGGGGGSIYEVDQRPTLKDEALMKNLPLVSTVAVVVVGCCREKEI